MISHENSVQSVTWEYTHLTILEIEFIIGYEIMINFYLLFAIDSMRFPQPQQF